MRRVGVGMVVVLAACTSGINSDPGSVTTTAPATTTTAPELMTTTTAEVVAEPVPEPTTIPASVEFPEVVESSTTTTIVKVFTSTVGPSLASGELAVIRACESGGDYTTDTGNGFYGAYQFSWGTWASVGGSGNPAYASAAEQDMRAQMLIDAGYRSAWPNC